MAPKRNKDHHSEGVDWVVHEIEVEREEGISCCPQVEEEYFVSGPQPHPRYTAPEDVVVNLISECKSAVDCVLGPFLDVLVFHSLWGSHKKNKKTAWLPVRVVERGWNSKSRCLSKAKSDSSRIRKRSLPRTVWILCLRSGRVVAWHRNTLRCSQARKRCAKERGTRPTWRNTPPRQQGEAANKVEEHFLQDSQVATHLRLFQTRMIPPSLTGPSFLLPSWRLLRQFLARPKRKSNSEEVLW